MIKHKNSTLQTIHRLAKENQAATCNCGACQTFREIIKLTEQMTQLVPQSDAGFADFLVDQLDKSKDANESKINRQTLALNYLRQWAAQQIFLENNNHDNR